MIDNRTVKNGIDLVDGIIAACAQNINHTDAQMATRKALAATEYQIAQSAYTYSHIRYMESMNYVLRIQDDTFVYVVIGKDGSYETSIVDKD